MPAPSPARHPPELATAHSGTGLARRWRHPTRHESRLSEQHPHQVRAKRNPPTQQRARRSDRPSMQRATSVQPPGAQSLTAPNCSGCRGVRRAGTRRRAAGLIRPPGRIQPAPSCTRRGDGRALMPRTRRRQVPGRGRAPGRRSSGRELVLSDAYLGLPECGFINTILHRNDRGAKSRHRPRSRPGVAVRSRS